jgi:ribonuclease HIII
VKQAAIALIQAKGPEALETHAKMHFKTASEVLDLAKDGSSPA